MVWTLDFEILDWQTEEKNTQKNMFKLGFVLCMMILVAIGVRFCLVGLMKAQICSCMTGGQGCQRLLDCAAI